MMQSKKTICIVEDKTDLREGMNMMVQLSDHYELGGSYGNAEEAIKEIHRVKPEVVLMDINLPGASGIQCVNALKNQFPNMLFLMCTAYEDTDKIFDSLKAGASGYILKTEGPKKIIEALDDLLAGGSPMSSSIARKVVASFTKMGKDNSLVETLSDREKMVLDQLAKGLIGKEVADVLDISWGTVRKHVQNIYKKLQVNTRVEAVNLYLKR
ncbi:MAG: response regulator transcription factor [Gloeobacteraceae cyanobacterium ES-bin-316]|nr:response regulator transcription factor [Ferruginibacter sp.]